MSTPPRRFRSAMLDRPSALLRWLGRKMFDHIRLDDAGRNRIETLGTDGQLVYVMWTRSTLDYLFFNYLFLNHTIRNSKTFKCFTSWIA